jgi:hypothetical protein
VLPPSFPLTAFVLTSGALKVGARVIRFGTEAVLARRYGTSVLRMLESETAQRIVIALVIVSIVGTAIAIARVWRGTSRRRPITS